MGQVRGALNSLLAAAENGGLEAFCERFGLDLVSVFGSSLDPDVGEPGDLDVAIRFEDPSSADVVGAVGALAELVGSDQVDVMVLNGAGVVARSRALRPQAKGLFEKRPGLYALAQMAALAEEMETAPMRRRDLELLARRQSPL
jgi:predicted nucleotidyltransferase